MGLKCSLSLYLNSTVHLLRDIIKGLRHITEEYIKFKMIIIINIFMNSISVPCTDIVYKKQASLIGTRGRENYHKHQ